MSMNRRIFLLMAGLAATAPLSLVLGQTAGQSGAKAGKSSTDSKTPWGDPDIQGTWTSDDTWGVPLARPKEFGTRATWTEDELKARAKNISRSEEFVDTGGDNHSPAKAQID